ncbi:MAG: hypothetical protein UD961_04105 [Bacteroidales bacterium]|nr:hypothetical protein [Bacteroidales bacterium]
MKKILYTLSVMVFISVIVLGVYYSKTLKLKEEVTVVLNKVYELEMAYKEMFGHYTDNIYALVFIQDTLVTEGGEANYLISSLSVTDSTFTATAVSVVDFDRDGQFNTWTVNEMGIITEIVED